MLGLTSLVIKFIVLFIVNFHFMLAVFTYIVASFVISMSVWHVFLAPDAAIHRTPKDSVYVCDDSVKVDSTFNYPLH